MEPSAIVLAAGAARRFGADKLSVPLKDGMPVILRTIYSLRDAVSRIIVVVRTPPPPFVNCLPREVIVVPTTEAEKGIGSSLSVGVRSDSHAPGWLVALGDMPFVRPDTIRAVGYALATGSTLAAPFYRGVRGHPVLFGRDYFDELAALHSDLGAKTILTRYARNLTRVNCNDPGVLRDVDYPEDIS